MKLSYNKLISSGALISLAGYLLSGPVGFAITKLTAPQPEWVSAAVFAQHYHPIQDLSFYFGFLLIGGMLMLAAEHYLQAKEEGDETKFNLLLSVLFSTIFSALIFFNYICQVSFIPHMARHYKPEYDFAIATFSMSNPMSLSWNIEMWGYGILGMATWLMAGYYRGRNNTIRILLIVNGIVSVLCAIATAMSVQWIITGGGLAAYMLWNVLMVAIMILMYKHAKKHAQ